mmetsp:Transcript_28455/g.92214  ORF Transcript_28455/g.92214 Transcript_28455/m.92214 type:complete len:310 (+) Transcript_28455:2497-3426(+)
MPAAIRPLVQILTDGAARTAGVEQHAVRRAVAGLAVGTAAVAARRVGASAPATVWNAGVRVRVGVLAVLRITSSLALLSTTGRWRHRLPAPLGRQLLAFLASLAGVAGLAALVRLVRVLNVHASRAAGANWATKCLSASSGTGARSDRTGLLFVCSITCCTVVCSPVLLQRKTLAGKLLCATAHQEPRGIPFAGSSAQPRNCCSRRKHFPCNPPPVAAHPGPHVKPSLVRRPFAPQHPRQSLGCVGLEVPLGHGQPKSHLDQATSAIQVLRVRLSRASTAWRSERSQLLRQQRRGTVEAAHRAPGCVPV